MAQVERWRTSRRALRKISAQKVRTSPAAPRPRVPEEREHGRELTEAGGGREGGTMVAQLARAGETRGGKKARNLRTTENQQTRSNAYSLFLDHRVYIYIYTSADQVERQQPRSLSSFSLLCFSQFQTCQLIRARARAHLREAGGGRGR